MALTEVDFGSLEERQALLLGVLRRAAGAPVSYDELRDAGIEFPASVVSELELAGVPIERCHQRARGGGRVVGVRLEAAREPSRAHVGPPSEESAPRPAVDPERASAAAEPPSASAAARGEAGVGWAARAAGMGWRATHKAIRVLSAGSRTAAERGSGGLISLTRAGSRVTRWDATLGRARAGGARGPQTAAGAVSRWLAPVGLVAAAVVVAALLVALLVALVGGGSPARRSVAHRPPPAPPQSATRPAGTGRASPPQAARHPPPMPVSAALATQLEGRGHDLLDAGRYGDAAPVLRRALIATGERPADCLEPASQACLTYAYALYDLGRALRLGGDPAAAVPALQRRLQIDNQRATVQAELELAREQTK